MTNIIKSFEWDLLANLAKEQNELLYHVLHSLAQNTEKFEQGEGLYPKVEFVISLIMDKKKNIPSVTPVFSPPTTYFTTYFTTYSSSTTR